MDPVVALERLGGIASHAALLRLTSRTRLRTALAHGRIRRSGRGRYVLPVDDQARRVASMCGGVLTHLSAALHHGWELRMPPVQPQIAVPRDRPLPRIRSGEVRRLPRRAVIDGWATDPVTTVLACARDLPFADALAVADSALRHGGVGRAELLDRARTAQERKVARHADPRAANPFESTLPAILIEEGFEVIAQYEVRALGLTLHPDLADPLRGFVFEAESWEFHGRERRAFESDCERYNALVATGWRVLRFTWVQVVLEPETVRRCLRALLADHNAAS